MFIYPILQTEYNLIIEHGISNHWFSHKHVIDISFVLILQAPTIIESFSAHIIFSFTG